MSKEEQTETFSHKREEGTVKEEMSGNPPL